MVNSVIITPRAFKEQLIIRIKGLLSRQPEYTYMFDEPINIFDEQCVGISTVNRGKELKFNFKGEDGKKDFSEDANEFFIENIWDVYLACEPIYQHKMTDYGNFEG